VCKEALPSGSDRNVSVRVSMPIGRKYCLDLCAHIKTGDIFESYMMHRGQDHHTKRSRWYMTCNIISPLAFRRCGKIDKDHDKFGDDSTPWFGHCSFSINSYLVENKNHLTMGVKVGINGFGEYNSNYTWPMTVDPS
jgi:hypothetical protein